MTDEVARARFANVLADMHEAGWDVLAVISKKTFVGVESHQRVLLHGENEAEKARAFFRCNREFKDELTNAALNVPISGRGFYRMLEESSSRPDLTITREDLQT